MSPTLQDTLEIAPGVQMARLGFGVYLSPEDTCVKSCTTALENGYRHIDSAGYYENEAQVGQAIKQSSVPRNEIFVTTKIFGSADWSPEEAYENIVEGVKKFGLEDGVDLFLIHGPTCGPVGRLTLWQALEKLKENGKTRAIGVSNFGVRHLQQLKENSKTKPAVNQIELHPFCQQKEIVEYCQKEGIVVQAYCPLVRAQKNEHPVIAQLAKKHSVDAAQILIRWSLQKGFVPLPKSDTPSRIKSNADVYGFELTKEDMDELARLDEGHDACIAPNNVNVE